jgi:alpha-tubulin suppressor-like RCC1 family protein
VAGPSHACVILHDGKVSCWGNNDVGENGSSTNYLDAVRELVEPQTVVSVADATELALTRYATCATTAKGDVWCWGRAEHPEQRVRGPADEHPMLITGLHGASSLTANEGTFCAIKDEKVVCWGRVDELAPNAESGTQKVFESIEHARRVHLGDSYGCAVDADGSVYCFGENQEGELGLPTSDPRVALDPVKVEGIPRAVDVTCGDRGGRTACALSVSHELWCWGRFDWSPDLGIRSPTRIKVL